MSPSFWRLDTQQIEEPKIFRDLAVFEKERSAGGAFGCYIAYVFIGNLLGMNAGYLFAQDFEAGLRAGQATTEVTAQVI